MKQQIKNFWSLNVDEALVANWLKQKDTLGSNYEIFFPVNFQFPFVDLIVYNSKNKKTTTIQVKSSQGYLQKYQEKEYWVSAHRFEINKIKSDKVDFFIFSCFYPESYNNKQNKTGERKIRNYFVVIPTTKLEKYVKEFKSPQVIKSGKIGFSFYIWDKKLYEDWYLKPPYDKNYENRKVFSNAKDNWKIIKKKLD